MFDLAVGQWVALVLLSAITLFVLTAIFYVLAAHIAPTYFLNQLDMDRPHPTGIGAYRMPFHRKVLAGVVLIGALAFFVVVSRLAIWMDEGPISGFSHYLDAAMGLLSLLAVGFVGYLGRSVRASLEYPAYRRWSHELVASLQSARAPEDFHTMALSRIKRLEEYAKYSRAEETARARIEIELWNGVLDNRILGQPRNETS